MLSAEALRKLFALFVVVLLSIPLPVFAQDEKKDEAAQEEKKDEKKPDPLPLKPARTIKFTTNEGTWMSLDVSPDGRTLVFDLLGDIYTMPVEGGTATKIHGGMSFESQPRFSPDGQMIVFLSDRSGSENVWVMKADGGDPKAVTTGQRAMYVSPSWSEDGNYIVVSKSDQSIGTFHPFMYHKDGGTGVSVGPAPPPMPAPGQQGPPPAPRPNRMGAIFSPDGKYIYYAQRTGPFNYNASFPLWQIFRFDRDTGETTRITNAQGSAMRPVLSPDGKHLVYATRFETRTALRVRDLETNQERWLIDNVTRDDQESRATRDTYPGYTFMPDGRSLIVPINGKVARVDLATGQATDIPFTVDVDVEVGPRVHFQYRVDDGPTVDARLIRYPAVSPNGKRVAFTAFSKLYVMDLPSGTPRRVTTGSEGEFMPAWSPDGKSIAYVTWSRQGGQIMSVSPEGGSPRQLTRRAAFYSYPAYSPDGSKIAFLTGAIDDHLFADIRDGHEFMSPEEEALHGHHGEREITGISGSPGTDLKYIPANGGDPVHISASQGGRFPHFSDDPDRVYMTTNMGLASIRLDGQDRRIHMRVTGRGTPPQQPPASAMKISPDRSRVFVELQGRHYIVTVPRSGRDTINVNLSGPNANVPFKRMSTLGGDYIAWAPDGKSVSWSWGTNLYRQGIDADKPETTNIKVSAARPKPSGTVVLSGARIITMKGSEIIERGDIAITDNRIVAVGPRGRVQIPAGARTIDVSGKTIIPGFVDVHAHMWPPRDIHQDQVWQYLANLAYGVTTTRDPQSSTTDVYAYADLVETGEILGPRVYTTGPGVFSAIGLTDKESVDNYIKRYREAYQTDTLKQYVVGDRNVRQWVAMACYDNKISPTTEGALDMKLNLSQMIDGYSGHEHSLPLQPVYKDVVEFVARTQTFYTPTILVAYGGPWAENYYFQNTDVLNNKRLARYIPGELLGRMLRRRSQWFRPEEYSFRQIAADTASIIKAGGLAGIGGHGQLQGLGVHWEIWAMQSGGMSTHDTLRVATIMGAEAIGLEQDLGSLEPGKLADLIVMDKNPLLDIQNTDSISLVIKNGELFEAETLNQIWPVQKPLPTQYWWDTGPK
ncbi:MAG TPA: amidohydrolase family protein [Pyrinomonadaceae bacterium]|nr:amidohydrolase family protein [Pyrinomonadaceae bacterium]HMP65550.1 amidohydrolase family protein [Pyrinomonadaceae bacterium]